MSPPVPSRPVMIAAPLQSLVRSLTAEFRKPRPSGRAVADLLAGYASEHDDWRSFALASPCCYTRNLVEKNEHYELLVLCWDRDQRSPIHNHEGQDCWMTILEGPIEEVHYRFDPGAPPVAGRTKQFGRGEVAFIRDEIALHDVRSPGESPVVSLHLYASPIAACNCYCEKTGQISRRELSYDTVRGVPR